MDVAFTAFITLGVWFMQRFLDSEKFRELEYAAIALGIATLIKGPMAIVIGIVLFALEWWRRRRIPRGRYAGAIALLIIVPLLWFIPATIAGGRAFTHDVLQKQLAGRAVGAWVHASPPWYYIAHSPGFLFPWFVLGVTAIAMRWRAQRFNINWILAVLVPYSVMSSKLDVYMMAAVPPLSLAIADCVEHAPLATRRANLVMLIALAAIGFSVFFVSMPKLPVNLTVPATLLITAAILGLIFFRGPLASTIAVGIAPLAAIMVIVCGMMPGVNEYASTRPLIRALVSQHVPPERIALYSCPYLWSRDMPRELERVQYVTPQSFASANALVVATSSKHANEIDLRGYAKSASVQMIGKWFDVDRR